MTKWTGKRKPILVTDSYLRGTIIAKNLKLKLDHKEKEIKDLKEKLARAENEFETLHYWVFEGGLKR